MPYEPAEQRNKKLVRNLLLGGGAVLTLSILFGEASNSDRAETPIKWSEFVQKAETGDIKYVVIQENTVKGYSEFAPATTKPGYSSRLALPHYSALATTAESAEKQLSPHVKSLEVVPPADPGFFASPLFFSILPMAMFLGLIMLMQRRQGANIMGMASSKAKLMDPNSGDKKTFADLAGIDEAVDEVREVVDFLKNPTKYTRLGAKLPKGILLAGSPGTGKTLLARAVAGEAGVPFYSIDGSHFVEMFVGMGAARVRDMFAEAKKTSPCVIFIDEIDALAKARGGSIAAGGHDEREQTLNALLSEMDGFEKNNGIIIIGATNRPEVLDKAILRPGRFDRTVVVPLPDIKGREKILQIHSQNKPLAKDIDLSKIARATSGFSGAALANLVNEAAMKAAKRGSQEISLNDFMDSRDKVSMGSERKSTLVPEKIREMTAYHEAGHALMMLHERNADPLERVSIVPRGMAGGVTMSQPDEEELQHTFAALVARLRVLMGGRVGEVLLNGQDMASPGASSDIQMATNIARHMVAEWGMSENLGMINYADSVAARFLDQENGVSSSLSDEKKAQIDAEISRLAKDAYDFTFKVLSDPRNLEQLDKLAKVLLEKENLDADAVKALVSVFRLDDPLLKDKGPSPIRALHAKNAGGATI